MIYAKDTKRDTVYTTVNLLVQPKKYSGLSVMPPYPASLQAKRGGANEEPVPKETNHTGMPDNLKTGVENRSGFSMDDVRVHYNSSKPAQLQALAYTQRTDIHVAPGQEKHLPHEAWHVIQQKQGRVQPTFQMKEMGVRVNDDAKLEQEADEMGEQALQQKRTIPRSFNNLEMRTPPALQSRNIEARATDRVIQQKNKSATITLKPDDRGKDSVAEKRLERKKSVEKFETKKTKLFGLEKVYQEYRLYKTLLSSSNLSISMSMAQMQSGYIGPGIGGGLTDTYAINRQRDVVNNSLKTYGFKGGIAEFEQAIKDYETGFENESVYIANNLLDCYSYVLLEAQKRYANGEVINTLFNQLAAAREHYQRAEGYKNQYFWMSMSSGGGMINPWSPQLKVLQQMQQEKELGRKGVEALTANHPLFKDDHLPEGKRLDKGKLALAKNGKELQAVLSKYISERQNDISETRKHLKDKPTLIYSLDNLLAETYRQQAIGKNSIYDFIINDKARDIKLFNTVISLALAIFAVALGLLSGGTGALAVIAAAGAVGLSAFDVYREIDQYQTQSHLAGTGLTSADANIIWVVVAVVGAGLDIGAAVKTAKALKPAVKAMEATGDLAKFEDGVHAVIKAREIDAKVADAVVEAVKARAGFQNASQQLTRKLGAKVYSFPGPLTDPDIYADLVKMAYYKVKEGMGSFQTFYLEIKKTRTLAKLGEMSPQELAKLKQAWEEGLIKAKLGVKEAVKTAYTIEKISYGSSDLSKVAIEFRKVNRILTARNVAVFEYTENGISKIIAMVSERGVGHAERLIANNLEQMGIRPSQVTRIFSELEPCSVPGGYCKKFIQNTFPQAKVTYCFEYGETAASRATGVDLLKQELKNLDK